jgi:hypothetical protein
LPRQIVKKPLIERRIGRGLPRPEDLDSGIAF